MELIPGTPSSSNKIQPNYKIARASYAPNIEIVKAPDYVFEGWGFDTTKEGDERFIQPILPEGWEYDINTGTFYPENFKDQVKDAVNKNILSPADYLEITGEEYHII